MTDENFARTTKTHSKMKFPTFQLQSNKIDTEKFKKNIKFIPSLTQEENYFFPKVWIAPTRIP